MIENGCHRGRFHILSMIFNKKKSKYFWMQIGPNKTEAWEIDIKNFKVRFVGNSNIVQTPVMKL